MCMWFPMYPWVGLLIVVRFLRSALDCHYARLWYLAVFGGQHWHSVSSHFPPSHFEDTVSRPTVFPTKSRKFYQRLLVLFILIPENTWEGSKNFSVLSNLTVVNTIRTSRGNNKKTFFFALCRIDPRIYSIWTGQTTRLLSVLSSTAMVR